MKNLLILSLIFLFTGCTDKTITRIYLEKNSKKMTAGNVSMMYTIWELIWFLRR